MKNLTKKSILTIVLALMLTFVFGLTACGDKKENNDENNFVITVVYADGTAVDGKKDGTAGMSGSLIRVQICDKTNETSCYAPQDLGADGILKVDITTLKAAVSADTYAVKLIGVKDGYTYQAGELSETNKTVTITLTNAQ